MLRRKTLLAILLRVGLVVSLLAAALFGAIVATELRPAPHVIAAHPPVQPPAPTPTRVVPRPVPTPAAPERAMLAPDGEHATADGAWIQSRSVTLRITLTSSYTNTMTTAEAELLPADLPFSGNATIHSTPVFVTPGAKLQAPITVHGLLDGQRYHWRVRAWTANGKASDWSGGGSFGVSVSAPLPPQMAMAAVRIGGWSTATRALFRWTDTGSRAPIAYYEYAVHTGRTTARARQWQETQGSVLALTALPEGRQSVLVRAVDLAGNHSKPAIWRFAITRHAPPAPRIVAATPLRGSWTNVRIPSVRWLADPAIAPLHGYQYAIASASTPRSRLQWTGTTNNILRLPGLADGAWMVWVRSLDEGGWHSPAVSWTFQLDRVPPPLSAPVLSATTITPPVQQLHLRLSLGKQAAISYRVYAVGKAAPVRSGALGLHALGPIRDLVWDGRMANKKLAAAGAYSMVVQATDRAGNVTEVRSGTVTLLSKRILISIRKEALWAHEGDKLVFYTLVTNGGPDTPTIPGIFHVQGKYNGFVFHSPWPKGSPLWYPDSPTSFALLYEPNGGYFLHDAPWRSNFGPGSNSVAGTPGGDVTGTHGCTNVPYPIMAQIFAWADVGTLIQIVR